MKHSAKSSLLARLTTFLDVSLLRVLYAPLQRFLTSTSLQNLCPGGGHSQMLHLFTRRALGIVHLIQASQSDISHC